MNTDKIYAQSIAKDYAPSGMSKVNALKKLDKKAKMPSFVFSMIFGVISALILGTGMCLCMNQIGPKTTASMVWGVIIGVIGIIGMSINYPIYKKLLKKGKDKYAFEIITLANEISDSNS